MSFSLLNFNQFFILSLGPIHKRVCDCCVCVNKPAVGSGSNRNVCADLHTDFTGGTESGTVNWCWIECRSWSFSRKLMEVEGSDLNY